MDYQFIEALFTLYNLPTLIIALIVSIISIIVSKIFKGKLPFFVTDYAPFILSLLSYFIFDTVFVKGAFTLSEDTFLSGILSGSLSIILVKAVESVKSGKAIKSPAVTVIEHLLEGVVCNDALSATAIAVESLIISLENKGDNEQFNKDALISIVQIIKENSDKEHSESDLTAIATLILNAVSVL